MSATTQDPSLRCRIENRRAKARAADWNGIDYLEVADDRLRLKLIFLGRVPEGLTLSNVRIHGGRRVQDIRVTDLRAQRSTDPRYDDCLEVTVDKTGDFSTYRICLVDTDEIGRPTEEPLDGFDPRYACLDFSFKAGCPSSLDCKPNEICPPPDRTEPQIDYLARDYTSLRKLILDRLSLIMPDWCERHVPDLGITLVELLAYAGDRLSYMQDSVATEAYLDTARQRVSVKRHARLVDYWMHEGCNARAWVCLWTDTQLALDLTDLCLLAADLPETGTIMGWDAFQELPETSRHVFEPIVGDDPTAVVRPAHNRIRFYTWADEQCCLPSGAMAATLVDEWVDDWVDDQPNPDTGDEQPTDHPGDDVDYPPNENTPVQHACDDKDEPSRPRERLLDLQVGDVLIFEEVLGPRTGNPADADPAHRHAVCITSVEPIVDPVCDQPVVEITWSPEDALPFPLCISTQGPPPDCDLLEDVSVACGNVILVDHGLTCRGPLGKVPLATSEEVCGDPCNPPVVTQTPGLFRPRLVDPSLTFCEAFRSNCPARDAVRQDPRGALAHIELEEFTEQGRSASGAIVTEGGPVWTVVRDLLASTSDQRHFVVEVENDDRPTLRFGNGQSGRRPEACVEFRAVYRLGNGPSGNVGAAAINHLVSKAAVQSGLGISVRNPLPAVGGAAAESMDEVRLFAPHSFRRVLARAVTAEDYVTIVERDFEQVQRAAATLRFTGSHTEVLVAVDQAAVTQARPELIAQITRHLERYRRIGHDVMVVTSVDVPLDLEVIVCVLPEYLSGHVEAAVRDALSARQNLDGTRGLFHPDNLSFGEGVYVSRIVAAVQAIDGVESVRVSRLERLFEGSLTEIELGILELGPFEVARLDNDPSLPENGRLTLDMRGGR